MSERFPAAARVSVAPRLALLSVRLARLALFAPFALLGAGGCVWFGVAAKVYGDPPIKARYVPEQRAMVVYVEGLPDPAGEHIDEPDSIARAVEEQIRAHEGAPIVPSVTITDLRTSRPAEFGRLAPPAIARAVGAEQMLWLQVFDSTIDVAPGTGMYKGKLSVDVRVIDAADGRQLWPTESTAGATVSCDTPMLRATDHVTAHTVRRDLYEDVADRVGKLFYTYKPE